MDTASSINKRQSSSSNISLKATLTASAVLGAVGISANLFQRLVAEYGWHGALSYIWEGDPYPHIRQYLDLLESLSTQLTREKKILNCVQEALEQAQLKSDKGAGDEALFLEWQSHLPPPAQGDLKKTLGGLSYRLDQLASKIDAVPGSSHDMVKRQKTALSNQIVVLMEEMDQLVAFFHIIFYLSSDNTQSPDTSMEVAQ